MNDELRGLLNEIAGDCRVAYGVTEESYRAYCRNGAMGTFPADTWAVHCQRRLGQIEQALASLSVAQGQGWLPIESAPRGGRTMILLLTPSRFPQVAFSNTWWTAGFSVECKPTHWHPIEELPAAPAQPDGVE